MVIFRRARRPLATLHDSHDPARLTSSRLGDGMEVAVCSIDGASMNEPCSTAF